MKKDNRFVSPPGALQFTDKKALVTERDMKRAEKGFDTIAKQLNLTPIDDTTVELIRARKKQELNNSATAQH
ncbi:MAG: hypothetical protein JXA44_13225 [Methanospirillaceae archaeon]|nr:hypothetical protein [Methanospirillaceae archaeon]